MPERGEGLEAGITGLLVEDGTYTCLMTVPGLSPRTASDPVIGSDIDDFPRPRPPRVLLRDRAQEQAVGQVNIVGELISPGEQAVEEPAHFLLQLALQQQEPARRPLPQLQGSRHAPWNGPENRLQEEIEGNLRDHGGQSPVLGLASLLTIESRRAPWGPASALPSWEESIEEIS